MKTGRASEPEPPQQPQPSGELSAKSPPVLELQPQGLSVSSSRTWGNGEERLVFSFPLQEAQWPTTLTCAERAVAVLMLDGATSAEIALHRGTSQRTVTNQVASIFRKTNVASRAELAAHVFTPRR